MSAPVLDRLMGDPSKPPACKVLGPEISCHWWPVEAKSGDSCYCGELKLKTTRSSPRRKRGTP